MSLLEQDETVATVLVEQLARVRAVLKSAEWGRDGECMWCRRDYTEGHDLECEAFTVSGIPK